MLAFVAAVVTRTPSQGVSAWIAETEPRMVMETAMTAAYYPRPHLQAIGLE